MGELQPHWIFLTLLLHSRTRLCTKLVRRRAESPHRDAARTGPKTWSDHKGCLEAVSTNPLGSTPRALRAMSTALDTYQDRLEGARRGLKDRQALRILMGAEVSPALLHAFLIEWAALTMQLQEPAERFLVEASRRCAEVGEQNLSLSLLQIAGEAIERYRLVADDTRRLAQLWNARRLPHINLTELLTQSATASMKRLHARQQSQVDGPRPWTQLAAVYEAEATLGSVAARVSAQAEHILGADVRSCLRSLDALANYQERGSLNRTMVQFLDANPERVDRMAETGECTLEIYMDFLGECCVAAANLSSAHDRHHAVG